MSVETPKSPVESVVVASGSWSVGTKLVVPRFWSSPSRYEAWVATSLVRLRVRMRSRSLKMNRVSLALSKVPRVTYTVSMSELKEQQ